MKPKINPPAYLVSFMFLMTVLNHFCPVTVILIHPYTYLGLLLILLGLFIAGWARYRFQKRGLPVIPGEKLKDIEISGPYRFTRNPMYLGMLLILTGVAVAMGSLTPFLCPIAFFLVIDSISIPFEEKKMGAAFGKRYLDYKNKVRRWLVLLITVSLFLTALHTSANAARPDLTIVIGQTKHVITQNDFRQLQIDSVVVNDPVYKKHKRYTGYWLSDILSLEGIKADPKTVWTFTALDGYKASIAVADLQRTGCKAFVAIADLDKEEGWEKIQQGKEWISPGPYYLVWQTPLLDMAPRVKLPWPYQMTEISVENTDAGQEKLFADSRDKSGPVTRGHQIFQQNCVSCHSLNLEGGVLGPELNVPRNILEYEDRKFLKEFIGDPNSFRARSKMPAFNKTLSAQDLDDVLDYLAWMGKHKT